MELKRTLLLSFVRLYLIEDLFIFLFFYLADKISSFPFFFGRLCPRLFGGLFDNSRTYAKGSCQTKSWCLRLVCHFIGRLQLAHLHFPHQESLLSFQAILLIVLKQYSLLSTQLLMQKREREIQIKIASVRGRRVTLERLCNLSRRFVFVCKKQMKGN